MVKIKICGICRAQDVDFVNEACPDFAGFVFAPGRRQIDGKTAAKFRENLKPEIASVGVFVNAPREEIIRLFNEKTISIAQLHGEEDAAYINSLREETGMSVIKTIKAKDLSALEIKQAAGSYKNAAYILLDSGAGSGAVFNWDCLAGLRFELPWFLAGGINSSNIDAAAALNPFGIDVSSGAETDGVKNREKIISLTQKTRQNCVSALILAGGKGRRIGYDKKKLVLRGESLIETQIRLLKELFPQVIVSSNTPFEQKGVTVVRDTIGAGPLAGIYSAMEVCSGEYLYVVACDMPFISPHYIHTVLAAARTGSPELVASRRPDGFIEPFNALYHKSLRTFIGEALMRGEYKAARLFDNAKTTLIDAYSRHEFFNINTVDDLSEAHGASG
ncbi:MAG: hypothetical protein Pg6A_16120 [Termitinemataceae bacterium]|nr:MAG: hypothetical protein Pg6A_16120 [Termitinemataceae bacterium]